MNNVIDEIYSRGQLSGARKENTALLFKKTYMLKPAGVKMVSRVDLVVLDNIKSAYMKKYHICTTELNAKWIKVRQAVEDNFHFQEELSASSARAATVICHHQLTGRMSRLVHTCCL